MISEHRPGHFDEQAFRAEMQRLEKMEIPVLENELMWISRVVDEADADSTTSVAGNREAGGVDSRKE